MSTTNRRRIRCRSLDRACSRSPASRARLLLRRAPRQREKPAAPAAAQKTFATPEEAADALIAAAENFDGPALKAILGPDGD